MADIAASVLARLKTILSLMEFSSRMKDYYDIYYIANKFDFDGEILTEAVMRQCRRNGMLLSEKSTPKRMITVPCCKQ